ncbi:vWA domain-containing protein [Amycolatopsis sp. NBC_01480]|uniref:vWA domain-containing protein n=1 Tax=Amycolatopsis sp. NBC_01480 TaxID=2903562 RepID=UPI002E2CBF46|nr:VWA domain-containing protein [Amycolatopsis sp. NBC_01480]
MSEFAQDERHPVFPVFLVIDVSYSMAGEPIDAVNAALPDLREMIEDDPQVGEIARVSIITFSDMATSVLPLCDLGPVVMPVLAPQAGTNFAAAFRIAKKQIEDEIRGLGKGTRFYKPVVFFMSDGEHIAKEDWVEPLRALTDRNWRFNPEIVTFGFADAREDTLGAIATRFAFVAKQGEPASQVKEIMSALTASIRTTSRSFGEPQGGGLQVDVDTSKFTALPVQAV